MRPSAATSRSRSLATRVASSTALSSLEPSSSSTSLAAVAAAASSSSAGGAAAPLHHLHHHHHHHHLQPSIIPAVPLRPVPSNPDLISMQQIHSSASCSNLASSINSSNTENRTVRRGGVAPSAPSGNSSSTYLVGGAYNAFISSSSSSSKHKRDTTTTATGKMCTFRRVTYLLLACLSIVMFAGATVWMRWSRQQHEIFVKDQEWVIHQRDQVRAYCTDLLQKYSSGLLGDGQEMLSFYGEGEFHQNCSYLSDRSFQNVLLDPHINDIGIFGERMRAFAAAFSTESSCEEELRSNLLAGLMELMFSWISPDFNSAMQFLNLEMAGRGYVVCAGDDQMISLQTLIYTLRYIHNSTLPIEVYYFGVDDLSTANRKIVESMGKDISVIDLQPFFELLTPKKDDSSYVKSTWWNNDPDEYPGPSMKPFAMLASRFSEVVLLDADIGMLQPLEVILDFENFKESGAYFFTDRSYGVGPIWDTSAVLMQLNPRPHRRACERPVVSSGPAFEMDPGVIAIDKNRHLVGLLTACNLLREPQNSITNKFLSGSKEVFWIGFETALEPYSFSSYKPGVLGIVSDSLLCGQSLHFDEKGRPLWWNGGYFLDETAMSRKEQNSNGRGSSGSSIRDVVASPSDSKRVRFLEGLFFDDGGEYKREPVVPWKQSKDKLACLSRQSVRKRRLGVLCELEGVSVRALVDRQVSIYRRFHNAAELSMSSTAEPLK